MSGMSVTLSIHNTTRVPVLANIPSQDHHHTVILATMWQWRSWCSDSGEEDYSGVTVVEGPVVLQQCSATIWQWWRWWAWWRGLQCSDRGCQETNPTSVWHLWEFLEGGDNYHDKIIFPYIISSPYHYTEYDVGKVTLELMTIMRFHNYYNCEVSRLHLQGKSARFMAVVQECEIRHTVV